MRHKGTRLSLAPPFLLSVEREPHPCLLRCGRLRRILELYASSHPDLTRTYLLSGVPLANPSKSASSEEQEDDKMDVDNPSTGDSEVYKAPPETLEGRQAGRRQVVLCKSDQLEGSLSPSHLLLPLSDKLFDDLFLFFWSLLSSPKEDLRPLHPQHAHLLPLPRPLPPNPILARPTFLRAPLPQSLPLPKSLRVQSQRVDRRPQGG